MDAPLLEPIDGPLDIDAWLDTYAPTSRPVYDAYLDALRAAAHAYHASCAAWPHASPAVRAALRDATLRQHRLSPAYMAVLHAYARYDLAYPRVYRRPDGALLTLKRDET